MFSHYWIVDFVILLVTFWVLLYFYFTRKFNHWKNKNVPYIPAIPFFGNAFDVFTLRKTISEMTKKIYDSTTKPFIGFFIGDEPYLLIRDPELIKTVLVKDFAIFSNRTISENKRDDPMGSHMLFILKNPDWRNMRRKISPVFTSAKMKGMYGLIHEAGVDMIKYLEKKVAKNSDVEVREITGKYTTDAITSTSFGINAHCFDDENADFRKVSRRALNWSILERAISTSCYFIAPSLVKLFKLKFVDTESANFLRNAFWKTMTNREQSNFVRNDLLDILIEIKKQENFDDPIKLDGDKLVAQATQFFLAGYETTSTTLSFILYEFAKNPEVQELARNDVKQILLKYGDITYDSIKEMEYLDLCVKEGLRKYPILAFLDRRLEENYQLPGTNVILEKDTPIFISTWGLHYDPKYFSDPEKFDPLRFTEENINKIPPFTYLPFGEGPRNCIGARFANASMRSSLAKILNKFKIELSDKTQSPIKLDTKGFLLAPIGDLYLKFTKI